MSSLRRRPLGVNQPKPDQKGTTRPVGTPETSDVFPSTTPSATAYWWASRRRL